MQIQLIILKGPSQALAQPAATSNPHRGKMSYDNLYAYASPFFGSNFLSEKILPEGHNVLLSPVTANPLVLEGLFFWILAFLRMVTLFHTQLMVSD